MRTTGATARNAPPFNVAYCHQPRSGKPSLVTSCNTLRCSAVSPAYGLPLPPGSIASAICGSLFASTRSARAWDVWKLGIAFGTPKTIGTAPSHTPEVFSIPPTVWYAPPLAPYRYPRGRAVVPYTCAATVREYFAAAALARYAASAPPAGTPPALLLDTTYAPLESAKTTEQADVPTAAQSGVAFSLPRVG